MASKKKIKAIKKKDAKKEVKKLQAFVINEEQLINLAAMIAEGTAFTLGLHSKNLKLTTYEFKTINGWFDSNATESAKNFVRASGVKLLLNIIARFTGETLDYGNRLDTNIAGVAGGTVTATN